VAFHASLARDRMEGSRKREGAWSGPSQLPHHGPVSPSRVDVHGVPPLLSPPRCGSRRSRRTWAAGAIQLLSTPGTAALSTLGRGPLPPASRLCPAACRRSLPDHRSAPTRQAGRCRLLANGGAQVCHRAAWLVRRLITTSTVGELVAACGPLPSAAFRCQPVTQVTRPRPRGPHTAPPGRL